MAIKLPFLLAVVVSHALFVTLVTVVSSASIDRVNEVPLGEGDAKYPLAIEFIGVADGKAYFAEFNQTMNQTAAAAYCEASRLTLATIETQVQADFLNSKIPELGYSYKSYWTSGRESRKDTRFIWNGTEAQVNSSLVHNWFIDSGNEFCVSFRAHDSYSYFYALRCTMNFHPLCQT